MDIGRTIAALALLATGCLIVLAQAKPAQAQAPQADLTALKRDYRRAPPFPVENQALVDLGRELFFDPRISASGKTACARVCDWPHSSFHRFAAKGLLPPDWGGDAGEVVGAFGE
jgi:cytochrome c peroxidase